jgi:hypothetical protein
MRDKRGYLMEATELKVEKNGRQESNEGKYYYDIPK